MTAWSPHEFVDGSVALLADAFAAKDLPKGQEQDLQIQPQIPVVHVPDIVFKLLLPSHVVAAVNLGPAGDTRLDLMAAKLLGGVAVEVLHHQRPRADEGHVAPEHVEQLWQLIQTGRPEPEAKGREPPIIRQEAALVIMRARNHCAKLEHRKRSAVEAGALLTEEDGPAELDPHEDSQHEQHRPEHQQGREGDEKIEDAPD